MGVSSTLLVLLGLSVLKNDNKGKSLGLKYGKTVVDSPFPALTAGLLVNGGGVEEFSPSFFEVVVMVV